VNTFSKNSRLCPLGFNNCTTYWCWQINWGLVFFWGMSFLLAFTNYSTIPMQNCEGICFSFGRLVFILEMYFRSTMKGKFITGSGIRIQMSLIKTWFPKIPREDVQQIIGAHHNFHITCMESCESYRMLRKNAH
jgi:hypothetical protein